MATQTRQKKTYRNLSKLRRFWGAGPRTPYEAAHTRKRCPSHPVQHVRRGTLSTLALPHKVSDAGSHTSRVPRTRSRRKQHNGSHYSDHHSGKKRTAVRRHTPHTPAGAVARRASCLVKSCHRRGSCTFPWRSGRAGGGGSKTRQVALARHSHTHRGGRSRRERGCSQERSLQRLFRCTCVNSRREKAGGGGENGVTNHGSNNCGAVSLLCTSVEQHRTGKYRRLPFTTHSHTTTISRTTEKDFSQAVTARGKVNNLAPLSRSVSRMGTQRRGRRRKRWQVGGVAPPTPMFRGM